MPKLSSGDQGLIVSGTRVNTVVLQRPLNDQQISTLTSGDQDFIVIGGRIDIVEIASITALQQLYNQ